MKSYSVAQLKRDAKEGILSAVMTMRNDESISQEALPERMQGNRKIINSNTTALMFENPVEPSKPSYVWLPKASLIEYTDTYLRIYSPGYREPTETEQKVLDEWKEIEQTEEYQKQLETDCLTDGSVTYYQKLGFFRSHDMEYLMGTTKQRGLSVDFNRRNTGEKAFIQDENIRGEISLEYQIERVKTLETPSFQQQVQAAAEKAQTHPQKTIEKTEQVR